MPLRETEYKIYRLGLMLGLMLWALAPITKTYAQDMSVPTGLGEREQLELKEPYSKWFTDEYDGYKVDNKVLNSCIQGKKLENYHITIVMGTWCPDSRREVPRFYKILDNMVFPPVNVRLIFVDENKKDPTGTIEKLNIEYVPTIIILDKKGTELGRIVEKPKKSLEKDLCNILSDK